MAFFCKERKLGFVNYERLKKNQEFRLVYRRGRSCANDLLVLYKMKNRRNQVDGQAYNRVGISVSKKVGKSVVRSKVKRLISEAYRLSQQDVAKGYDLVIVARSAIVEKSYWEVLAALGSLYKKAGIKIEANSDQTD